METNSNIKEKRTALISLSESIKPLVAQGQFKNINDGLKFYYKCDGHEQFKTFEQWAETGNKVKKGAKAFYLWGKQKVKEIEENGVKKEVSFYPIIPVFSNLQIY